MRPRTRRESRGVLDAPRTRERELQNVLHRVLCDHWEAAVPNCHLFGWEADLVYVTRAGYAHEIEVKTSRKDLAYELSCVGSTDPRRHRKAWKHRVLSDHLCDATSARWRRLIPASFTIAVPAPWHDYAPSVEVNEANGAGSTLNAVSPDWPAHLGLIEVDDLCVKTIVPAPRLRRIRALTHSEWAKVARLLSVRYWSDRT